VIRSVVYMQGTIVCLEDYATIIILLFIQQLTFIIFTNSISFDILLFGLHPVFYFDYRVEQEIFKRKKVGVEV
jgi:hypothetical protein